MSVTRAIHGQKLEGRKAVEFGVLGLVDNPHAARSEKFDNREPPGKHFTRGETIKVRSDCGRVGV